MKKLKLISFFSFFTLIVFIFLLTEHFSYFSIDFFKISYINIKKIIDQNYSFYLLIFFLVYVIIASLSLPFAAAFSIFIGSIFHFFEAFFLVAIASSLGASVCFLISRYTMKEFFEKKFKKTFKKINIGVEKNGIYFLFFVRLVPIFPFFIINIFFGLTKIKLSKFILVSFIGMLPGIFLFVNAGKQISRINSTKDIFNFDIIVSFIMIGILPLVLKKVIYSFKLIKK
ncbi:MAG: TVP38/TMEM64 family protein [Pelagibacterales bacterium]|nr:TVP38/TMEM64 family protein [Pelagibacterales bacterium]